MEKSKFEVSEDIKAGLRLDVYLAEQLEDFSRARIQSLIKEGAVLLNGLSAKPKTELSAGDQIEVSFPEPVPVELQPEEIPLSVLHEDEDIIVINKSSGMVVHPAAGNEGGTLVNALLFHCQDLQGIGGEQRPGIVHRLDKDTSGCLVVAKNQQAHNKLTEQFKNRQTGKLYLAVGRGQASSEHPEITVKNRIARDPHNRLRMKQFLLEEERRGKIAHSKLQLLKTDKVSSSWLVKIFTGRTHQIRVHLKGLGHPILGDSIYGKASKQEPVSRLMLHAWWLQLTHPRSAQPMLFEAPIADEFSDYLPEHNLLEQKAEQFFGSV